MDEQLPGHSKYLMEYEIALGAAGRGGRFEPSNLVRYNSQDVARRNGGTNLPWHVSGAGGASLGLGGAVCVAGGAARGRAPRRGRRLCACSRRRLCLTSGLCVRRSPFIYLTI